MAPYCLNITAPLITVRAACFKVLTLPLVGERPASDGRIVTNVCIVDVDVPTNEFIDQGLEKGCSTSNCHYECTDLSDWLNRNGVGSRFGYQAKAEKGGRCSCMIRVRERKGEV